MAGFHSETSCSAFGGKFSELLREQVETNADISSECAIEYVNGESPWNRSGSEAEDRVLESKFSSAVGCIAELKQAKEYRIVGNVKKQFVLISVGRSEASESEDQNKSILFAVDQHAASERYEYEQILLNFADWQQPMAVKVSFRVRVTVDNVVNVNTSFNELSKHGFTVSPCWSSGTERVLKVFSVPKLLAVLYFEKADAQFEKHVETVERMIGALLRGKLTEARQLLLPVAKRLACVSAVRFGDVLSVSQMRSLVDSLLGCTDPAHCAHGRPTITCICCF